MTPKKNKLHAPVINLPHFLSVRLHPLAVESGSTPRPLVKKKTWRDSLPIDMLLPDVSVLVVAQSSSEIPEGLMNNPVFISNCAVLDCTVELCKSLSMYGETETPYCA